MPRSNRAGLASVRSRPFCERIRSPDPSWWLPFGIVNVRPRASVTLNALADPIVTPAARSARRIRTLPTEVFPSVVCR